MLTIGWLNPIYGMFETALAFVITIITILVPVIAVAVGAITYVERIRMRGRPPADEAVPVEV